MPYLPVQELGIQLHVLLPVEGFPWKRWLLLPVVHRTRLRYPEEVHCDGGADVDAAGQVAINKQEEMF